MKFHPFFPHTSVTGLYKDPAVSLAEGKALRKSVSRSSQTALTWKEGRPDPLAQIRKDESGRVSELLPIRHERMCASPFAFYRAGASIMAADLSRTVSTGLNVQAVGDAHIDNFGFFLSPERRLVFDLNDFDETTRGPWEWDLRRLAASVEICGRDRGFAQDQITEAVYETARVYHSAMKKFCDMGNLDVWYAHTDVEKLTEMMRSQMDEETSRSIDKSIAKANKKNRIRAASKLTEVVDGQLRFISDPPLIVPYREMDANTSIIHHVDLVEQVVSRLVDQYAKSLPLERRQLLGSYKVVDIARKVVGVGSVGTRCWMVMLIGKDTTDPLVLQIKEAGPSALEQYVGPCGFRNYGERVVQGQRAIQTSSDIFLGWLRSPDVDRQLHDYYVRQLWDGKGGFKTDSVSPDGLREFGKACGWTLAHAHARTGDRFAIYGYLGNSPKVEEAMTQFTKAYAEENERDYEAFVAARKAGKFV
ncbi:MAG: DUF2252 domain-containing protein [Acutalibacteraceae bacterium]|nr:DUF2252 domain-containing protein [Acutalibacteraceae bacterium]